MVDLYLGPQHCWFGIIANITAVERHGRINLKPEMPSPVIVVIQELTDTLIGFSIGLKLMARQAVAFQNRVK